MTTNHAVFFIGPAGSGKTTLCATFMEHFEETKRSAHLINLDPAASFFGVSPTLDIKEIASVEKIMEQKECGPNGGLVLCLEKMLENDDWLLSDLENRSNDFLIVDCPGQIEIYTHFDIMQRIINLFVSKGYRVCVVYLLESHFLQDSTKFISGSLSTLSSMVRLEFPHLNIISKMDLMAHSIKKNISDSVEKSDSSDSSDSLESEEDKLYGISDLLDESSEHCRYIYPNKEYLLGNIHKKISQKYYKLNKAFIELIEEYNLVSFLPVSIKDKDSIETLLMCIDNCVQYGEDLEYKEKD